MKRYEEKFDKWWLFFGGALFLHGTSYFKHKELAVPIHVRMEEMVHYQQWKEYQEQGLSKWEFYRVWFSNMIAYLDETDGKNLMDAYTNNELEKVAKYMASLYELDYLNNFRHTMSLKEYIITKSGE